MKKLHFQIAFFGIFVMILVSAQVALAQVARSSDVKENRAFIYYGKIVRPDNKTPTGSASVTIKIYSPDPELCLLWAETQTIELINGGFAAEIGHLSHRISGINGGAAQDFKQVFLNNPGLNINSAQCAAGNSYSPRVADDRLMTAIFTEGSNTFEVASLPIKSVPFALQAEEISGYGINNLMKVNGASNVVFEVSEVNALKSLLGGELLWDLQGRRMTNVANPTSAQDATTKAWVEGQLSSLALTQSSVTTGLGYTPLNRAGDSMTGVLGLHSVAADPSGLGGSDKGKLWFNSTSGEIKYWNGSTPVALGIASAGLTSVGLSAPAIFTVTGSPLTVNGSLGLSLASQSQNLFFASPNGAAGAPIFRSIAAADLPDHDANKITTGSLPIARGGTGLSPVVGDANKVFGMNAAGTGSEMKAITAGTGVSVNHSPGTVQISMSQANTSTAGFLSSADWNSFNDKQPALGFTPVSNALPSGQVYLGSGSNVAAASWMGIGQLRNSLGTLQFPGSCSASQTLTWSAVTDVLSCSNIGSLPASAITSGTIDSARLPASANLWQDGGSGMVYYNGGNVGIGTTSPSSKLEVRPGTVSSTAVVDRNISLGVHLRPVSGRSGYLVHPLNSYLTTSDDAAFGYVHPYDSTNAIGSYKVFRILTGTESVNFKKDVA